jgi:hypothetical protein
MFRPALFEHEASCWHRCRTRASGSLVSLPSPQIVAAKARASCRRICAFHSGLRARTNALMSLPPNNGARATASGTACANSPSTSSAE